MNKVIRLAVYTDIIVLFSAGQQNYIQEWLLRFCLWKDYGSKEKILSLWRTFTQGSQGFVKPLSIHFP